MNISAFDFGVGRVAYWSLDFLDPELPMTSQLEDLKEDLAVIEYPDGSVIDIGWYPEFSPSGWLIINAVRDNDWDSPAIQIKFRDPKLLFSTLKLVKSTIYANGDPGCQDSLQ